MQSSNLKYIVCTMWNNANKHQLSERDSSLKILLLSIKWYLPQWIYSKKRIRIVYLKYENKEVVQDKIIDLLQKWIQSNQSIKYL